MRFLFFTCLLAVLPYWLLAQQIILTHQPFEVEYNGLSYVEDTIIFDANQAIWGLTYIHSPVQVLSFKKEVQFSNAYGLERTAAFHFSPINPEDLNWHPVIRTYWQKIFDKQNWYIMKVTPYPSVVNAEEGVAFLEVFEDIIHKSPDLSIPQPLYYKLAENDKFRTCWIDFSAGQGLFEPLLDKIVPYREQITEHRQLRTQQITIEQKFEPQGFQQIANWGTERDSYIAKLKKDDQQIFMAIEKMKAMTEEVTNSITTEEKRLLRELFLLDINLLEAKEYERPSLQKRRTELFKRITVYPSLKVLVYQYEKLTQTPKEIKADEQLQEKKLHQISRKFKPYETQWKIHQKLQKQIDRLNENLKKF